MIIFNFTLVHSKVLILDYLINTLLKQYKFNNQIQFFATFIFFNI